ncbi:MAG: serine/threonine protein kinase, partial [Myxococcales bacterium]|nr:serine/threonine protein kinase [Myxococcales bacterium]
MGESIGNAGHDSALALSPTLAAPALAPTLSPEQAAAQQPEVRDESRVSVAGTTREFPARIGRYLILRRLGEGGMGVVYSAYDAELDRKVAIKLLRANHEGSMGQARMRREAQALAQLSHSHIVQVYEVGQDESLGQNSLFMAMEFVAGQPLSAWQTRLRADRRQLRPEDVGNCLRLYIQAGRGLLAAHSAGLVHRDFKPD